MKLRIGDKVTFLNEKGEGIVTKILNPKTVSVTTSDGFEIPYPVSELILLKSDILDKATSLVNNIEASESAIDKTSAYVNGIYAAITYDKKINEFSLWIINQSTYDISFSFSLKKQSNYCCLSASEVNEGMKSLVRKIKKENVNEFENCKIDILFYSYTSYQIKEPISKPIKLNTVKWFQENCYNESLFFSDQKAILFKVDNDINMQEELINDSLHLTSIANYNKGNFQSSSKISKPHNINSEMEIDLHIEELLDDYSGMSNAQIIQTQLNHLQKAINKAIEKKVRKLIVIHGVGNGKLKEEARKIISINQLRYYDASYAKYGYGATEVEIN